MIIKDNTQQPLVSFIVTYFNLPVEMLCECIDSILKLNLQPVEREIIIIDDGSDTSPINDLQRYSDDIIYVRQRNKGVSEARNAAMDMAKGRFIQIIDGDDFLLTEPYDHCMDIVRKHSDADVVIFDFTHQSNKTSTAFNPPVKKNGADLMRSENIRGTACCCLFSRAVRGQLCFPPGIAYGEDEEFTPQLLIRSETVYVTDTKAYFYRKRANSAVHMTDEASIQKRMNDTKEVILHLNQLANTSPHYDKIALQRRVAQLTMDYIYNTILLTRSEEKLNQVLKELTNDGLFPLPDHNYSTKYKWFRRVIGNRFGQKMLIQVLPLMKRER